MMKSNSLDVQIVVVTYMGAIGLTGKRRDSEGKIVDAYDICIGGEQGPSNKIGKIHLKKFLNMK